MRIFKTGESIRFVADLNEDIDEDIPDLSTAISIQLIIGLKGSSSPITPLTATIVPGSDWIVEAGWSPANTSNTGLYGVTARVDYGNDNVICSDTVNFKIEDLVTYR